MDKTKIKYLVGIYAAALDWQLHPNTSHIHPYMYG